LFPASLFPHGCCVCVYVSSPSSVNPSDLFFIPALLDHALRIGLVPGNHVVMQRLRLFLLHAFGAIGQRTPDKFDSYKAVVEQYTALFNLSPAALHLVTGQGLSGSGHSRALSFYATFPLFALASLLICLSVAGPASC
jgi:hypothetical protein